MEKDNKKKTLTITSDLRKKIDTTSISTDGKKSFAVKKKEPFKGNKIRIDGYLEEFSLSRKEADELIMSAREIAYK